LASKFIKGRNGTPQQRAIVGEKLAEMWEDWCVPYMEEKGLHFSSESESSDA